MRYSNWPWNRGAELNGLSLLKAGCAVLLHGPPDCFVRQSAFLTFQVSNDTFCCCNHTDKHSELPEKDNRRVQHVAPWHPCRHQAHQGPQIACEYSCLL